MANSRMGVGVNAKGTGFERRTIMRDYVKGRDLFMQIDADESGSPLVAPTRGGGAFGLGPGFGLSFDRAHGDKLHEALSQGWPPCALSTRKRPGGRIDTYLFELEAQPDWS